MMNVPAKLKKVRQIAKSKKIEGKINISTRKGKKFMIRTPQGKLIHFGSDQYEDFLQHGDEKRKKRFHSRFKNNKGYNNPESGLYYSQKLLW